MVDCKNILNQFSEILPNIWCPLVGLDWNIGCISTLLFLFVNNIFGRLQICSFLASKYSCVVKIAIFNDFCVWGSSIHASNYRNIYWGDLVG